MPVMTEQDRLDRCESDISALRAELSKLKDENEALHKDGLTIYAVMNSEEVDRLRAALAKAQEEIASIQTSFNLADDKWQEFQRRAESAEAKVAKANHLIRELQEANRVAESRVKELEAVDQRNAELIEERDQYKHALSGRTMCYDPDSYQKGVEAGREGLFSCSHEDPEAFNRGYVKGMEEALTILRKFISTPQSRAIEIAIEAHISEIKRAAESKEERG